MSPVAAEDVSLTRDQLRFAASRALANSDPIVARDIAMLLLSVDREDSSAYSLLANAHQMLGNPDLARAGARLAYRYAEDAREKALYAVQAAQVAVDQERFTWAQIWLRRAATQADTPQSLNQIARNYAQVRARNPLRVTLGFGVTPSSNVNNGSDSASLVVDGVPAVGLLSTDAQALSGWEYTSRESLRYRLAQSAEARTSLGAVYIRKDVRLSDEAKEAAPDAEGSDYDTRVLQFDLSQQRRLAFEETPIFLAGGVRFGRAWAGGDMLFDYLGLSARVQDARPRPLLPYATFGVEARFDADDAFFDTQKGSFGLGVLATDVGPGRLDISLTYEMTDSEDINSAFDQITLRTKYTFSDDGPWKGLSAGLTLAQVHYDEFNSGIALVPGGREDQSAYLNVSAVVNAVSYAGFAPKLSVTVGRRDSNDSRFNTDEASFGLEIVSRF